MNVVDSNFPIPWDGILGIQFLKQHNASLSFRDQTLTIEGLTKPIPFVEHSIVTLPARSKVLITLKVANPECKDGYIPRISAGPNVYLGECLAKNINGECKIFAYNCTLHNVDLTIPPVTLEEYYTPNVKMLIYAQKLNKPETQQATEARVLRIIESLNLEPLSEEERSHVIKIVAKFPNQFHLPDDPISFTDLIQHKINTNGAPPVNVKQFRHPPNIRDEIQRQVKELLEKDIIQESESPYNSPVFLVPKNQVQMVRKR